MRYNPYMGTLGVKGLICLHGNTQFLSLKRTQIALNCSRDYKRIKTDTEANKIESQPVRN